MLISDWTKGKTRTNCPRTKFVAISDHFQRIFFWVRWVWDRARGWGAEGAEGAEEVDQGEVSTIILGMLESSGFRKYSTLLVIQLFSRHLCVCHCLCIRLCLCICVPYSFLNSYYHKLENVWVSGSGASRSWDVTIAGRTNKQTNKPGKIGLLSQSTREGWDEQFVHDLNAQLDTNTHHIIFL